MSEAANEDQPVEIEAHVELPEPDVSFLTNPTDDVQVKIQERDERFLSELSTERRNLAKRARQHLKDGLAQNMGSVDTKSMVYAGHRYTDPHEGVPLIGKLTVKWTLKQDMVPTRALSKYLAEYYDFRGTVDEMVDQIAHDLFILLRPAKVSIKFVADEAGARITAQKTLITPVTMQ